MELDLLKSWAEKLNLLPAFLRAKHQLFLWSTVSTGGGAGSPGHPPGDTPRGAERSFLKPCLSEVVWGEPNRSCSSGGCRRKGGESRETQLQLMRAISLIPSLNPGLHFQILKIVQQLLFPISWVTGCAQSWYT